MLNWFRSSSGLSFFGVVISILSIIYFGGASIFLAALVSYTLLHGLLSFNFTLRYPKLISIFFSFISITLILLATSQIRLLFNPDLLPQILSKIEPALLHLKNHAPFWQSHWPANLDQIKPLILNYFQSHWSDIAILSVHGVKTLGLILLGWILGIILAQPKSNTDLVPIVHHWISHWNQFYQTFKTFILAQSSVALFNAFWVFLFVQIIAPIFSWSIPYSWGLVALTFICSLIPVIGNLIANTASFLVCMTSSLNAAIAMLFLLIIIHKLEYVIISKVMGSKSECSLIELLLVMLSFEWIFGVGGMILSPMIYIFVKQTLTRIYYDQQHSS